MCSEALCAGAEEFHSLSRKCVQLLQGLHSSCEFPKHQTPALVASSSWTVPPFANEMARLCWLHWLTRTRSLPWHSPIQVLSCGILPGSNDRKDFTVTLIDQSTTLSSWSVTAQSGNILDPRALVSFCQRVSASFLQATCTESRIQPGTFPTGRKPGNLLWPQ